MADNVDEFSSFVATRSAALFRTACFLTGGDRHAAQDLVQEALTGTFIRWSNIRDPSASEAYARRIMVRLSTKRWQRRRSAPEILVDHAPETGVPGHEDQANVSYDLMSALAALTPRQRAVVVLRYYEDMTEAQIADALNCSPGTVKSHGSRGLKALMALLDSPDYTPASDLPRRSHGTTD